MLTGLKVGKKEGETMRRRFRKRRTAARVDPARTAAQVVESPEFRESFAEYILYFLDKRQGEDDWFDVFYPFTKLSEEETDAYYEEHGTDFIMEVSRIVNKKVERKLRQSGGACLF